MSQTIKTSIVEQIVQLCEPYGTPNQDLGFIWQFPRILFSKGEIMKVGNYKTGYSYLGTYKEICGVCQFGLFINQVMYKEFKHFEPDFLEYFFECLPQVIKDYEALIV